MSQAKDEALRAKAISLARKVGVREASRRMEAQGHSVSKSTIAGWVRAEGTAVSAGVSKKAAGQSQPPARTLAEGAAALAESVTAALDLDAVDLQALEELDAEINAFRASAVELGDARTYALLARLTLEVRVAMHKVRPPPRVDPQADPSNVDARDALLARLNKLVAAASATEGAA